MTHALERTVAQEARGPGRPSKLTPEVVSRLLNAIRCGAPNVVACGAAGIGASTLTAWTRRARRTDAPREYREFAAQIEAARHEGNVARLAQIQKAGRDDWRAAAWLLERSLPEQFGSRHRLEHAGRLELPVDPRAVKAIAEVPGLLDRLGDIAVGNHRDEGADEDGA